MKLLFSTLFLALLFFAACKPAVVITKPVYVETARPASPNSNYIWVDGDWIYNRPTRAYNYRNGYYRKPNNGRTYIPGYWQTNKRGHYWIPGRW